MSTSKSFCEKESEGIYVDILTLIKRGDSIQTSVKSQRIWDTILTVDISFASRYFIKFWDPNPNPPQHTSVNIVYSRNEFNVKSSNVKSNNVCIGYVKQLMWKIFINFSHDVNNKMSLILFEILKGTAKTIQETLDYWRSI